MIGGYVVKPLAPVVRGVRCPDCGRPLVGLAAMGFETPGFAHLVLCIPSLGRRP